MFIYLLLLAIVVYVRELYERQEKRRLADKEEILFVCNTLSASIDTLKKNMNENNTKLTECLESVNDAFMEIKKCIEINAVDIKTNSAYRVLQTLKYDTNKKETEDMEKLYYFFNTLYKFKSSEQFYYPVPPNCRAVDSRVIDKDRLQELFNYYRENDIINLIKKYAVLIHENSQCYYGKVRCEQNDIYKTQTFYDDNKKIKYDLISIWQYSLFDGLLPTLLMSKTIAENVRRTTFDYIHNPNSCVNGYSPNECAKFQVAYGYPKQFCRKIIEQDIEEALKQLLK